MWAQTAPVTPNASPEARALLSYLYSISGRYTLSGQHNFANTVAMWTDRAYDLTGKYPAVYGQDFGFQSGADKDSTLGRPAAIEEMRRQHRNGAIVTLTWHAVRPTDDEPVSFRESVQGKLTDFEWNELTTPGTNLHNRWLAQVDVIAGYLKQLRDARVPVLWRPFHEVNGSWFWWGGRKGQNGSAALYRMLYDRLVKMHRLDNLIWVWNANALASGPAGPGPYTEFFPGLQYVDVVSIDNYGEMRREVYDSAVALAAGKPVALGEVGRAPSPDVLKDQPKWTWFMVWSEFVERGNDIEELRAVYNAPMTLSRDDPRMAGPMAAIRKASGDARPEPVTEGATAEAKELLVRLHRAAAEGAALSGQENDPRAVSAASDRVAAITSKRPAIYGQDLAPAAARDAVVAEAQRQARNGALVSLAWRAPRPVDDEPAPDSSAAAQLTDFEWNELLTPGTKLHERWCAQVDSVAASLKKLEQANVAVLWRPYPQANGARSWWAGRKGARGSAALYRQLFERLANHHKLRNLIWVWTAAPPAFGPDPVEQFFEFFPGLAYADALAMEIEDGGAFPFRLDQDLALFAVGKAIGLNVSGRLPAPAMFERQPKWAWFLAAPGTVDQADALRKLYDSGRVVSAPPPSARVTVRSTARGFLAGSRRGGDRGGGRRPLRRRPWLHSWW